MDAQRTLRRAISCVGIGLHSGNKVQLSLKPAPTNFGIRFRRADLGDHEVPANVQHLAGIQLATALSRNEVSVETVEHLLAALVSMGVDNVLIELNSPEVPIMDGSAAPFVYLIQEAGIKQQVSPRKYLKIVRPIALSRGDKRISLYPSGTVTLADTEALNGGRSYSLWDYVSELNAVVLYTTDGDDVTFTVLQRATGRKTELPSEPKVSPDRARLVTADFCDRSCVNELAVWRVTRDGIRKELTWTPRASWSDAVASWKTPETVIVEYTAAGSQNRSRVERRLDDPSWVRATSP